MKEVHCTLLYFSERKKVTRNVNKYDGQLNKMLKYSTHLMLYLIFKHMASSFDSEFGLILVDKFNKEKS